jgi:branched-chain amino acid transport system permease protein
MAWKKSDNSATTIIAGPPGRAALLHNIWVLPALLLLVPMGHWIENPEHVGPYYFDVLTRIGIAITLAVSLQLINGISGQFSLGHAGFMAVGAYLGGYATGTFGAVAGPDGNVDFANPAGVAAFFIAVATVMAAVALGLAIAVGLIRASGRVHAAAPVLLTILGFIWLAADAIGAGHYAVAPWFLVWTHTALTLGGLFTGMMSISRPLHAIFGLAGTGAAAPLSLLSAMLGGGAMAAVFGLIVGLPTLRLRGDYLAIATLGFGEIIRTLVTNTPALGGATGLTVPFYETFDDSGKPIRFIFPWIWGTVVVTVLMIWRLARSPQGLELAAVRDDEIAAGAVGIATTRKKVLAFVVGAFFAGVAGVLSAHFGGRCDPDSFGFMRSIELVVMVTLGGLGNIWGAAIAAIVLTLLPEVLDHASGFLPAHLAIGAKWIADNRMFVYAAMLILVMIARAQWRWPGPRRRGRAAMTTPVTT